MATEAWLPRGFNLGSRLSLREVLEDGPDWQIYSAGSSGSVLLASRTLALRWQDAGLLPEGALQTVHFGNDSFSWLESNPQYRLVPVTKSPSPNSAADALAFAKSLRVTRERLPEVPLQDSIYVEQYSTLLPTFSIAAPLTDDVVLGAYLSGGVQVSCKVSRRLRSILSWLPDAQLVAIVQAAGLGADEGFVETTDCATVGRQRFELPGRPALEALFRDHVIDIVENAERYKAMGIQSPSSIVLHGPPGCGKTFAVDKLVEYLGWPLYAIGSGTVGSPLIHETGRKIAELFANAIDHAPSIVVIDEMESFLPDRQRGSDTAQHRVEEVAEFLKCIPEAVNRGVLVIGMTNSLEMIDPAILRRGRFDHVVEVTMPTKEEVRALLENLLRKMPVAADVRPEDLAESLAHRPMSDVAFVVREAGRIAAKSGKSALDQESLRTALAFSLPHESGVAHKPIGFA